MNLTDKYTFDFAGSPVSAFASLREKQKVGYGAYLDIGGQHILSFSPELFFKIDRGIITTRPMKGTVRRGKTIEEDAELARWLQQDKKNRSENLMIVDLLRNDVGRISDIGSVRVRDMFSVEKYETLHQMTSTVEGTLRSGLSYYDIFRSIFPSGSVTGAPKIRTMQIIREIEEEPRGVYTGAIGFFAPNGTAAFNVPIRTLVIDGSRGEMGVGSGIVFDSDPAAEYEECMLKAQFLTEQRISFQLIESILWNGEFRFLEYHLDRLRSSAEYFEFPFDAEHILQALASYQTRLSSGSSYKVRLLLNADGTTSLESQKLRNIPVPPTVTISTTRTSSTDRFFYHKTTLRHLYDNEFSASSGNGHADILFCNERDEVTEGAIHNVFVEKDGKLFTPPLTCGLLPGVFRRHLLETLDNASERIISRKDLIEADAVYICNAVRGLRKVSVTL